MRILVSGGTGFIGGAIVSTLLKDPQFQVSVLSRDPKKADEKQTAKKTSTSNGSKVSYIKGDVTDPKSLPNFSDFDFVIQAAGIDNFYLLATALRENPNLISNLPKIMSSLKGMGLG
jgi:uncharacterized protein YbjT (DUF2867 family)